MIVLVVFVLAILALFFTQSTNPPIGESLWLMEFNIFGATLRFVDILTSVTIFFVSVMILLLFVILLNRGRMERRSRVKESLLEKYQELVLDYIETSKKEDMDALSKLMKTKFRKQLLRDQIVDVAKNLKGFELQLAQNLYFQLDLNKRTYRKIKRGHWHNKIKGIKELCALSITDENDLIIKYASSKNQVLRMEAQSALVELSRFDEKANPFLFLDEFKEPFSLWEQISLHQSMVERDIKPPDFHRWLFSDNPSVILFCLRMTREYKQTWNADWVKMLAWHDDENVRNLAYEVLGDLQLSPALKEVRKLYKDETIDNKREMIKSMRKAADPSLINFLKKVIDREEDAEVLVEAVRAINDCGEEGKETLDKMLKDKYKNYNIIIKHVKDRKIS